MKLLLIRHAKMAGDPFATPLSPVSGCLAPAGVEQARALAARLADEPIDLAFSSPYGRAVQTAEIALEGRGVPLKRVPGLQEWTPSEAFRNAVSTEASAMAAREAALDAWATWKTELGEGTYDMLARVVPALLGALAETGWRPKGGGWEADPGTETRTIAIFAHGGSLNAMLSFLIGLPAFPVGRFSFPHTGIATLTFSPRAGLWFPAIEFA